MRIEWRFDGILKNPADILHGILKTPVPFTGPEP
jgi:hypothetical protein